MNPLNSTYFGTCFNKTVKVIPWLFLILGMIAMIGTHSDSSFVDDILFSKGAGALYFVLVLLGLYLLCKKEKRQVEIPQTITEIPPIGESRLIKAAPDIHKLIITFLTHEEQRCLLVTSKTFKVLLTKNNDLLAAQLGNTKFPQEKFLNCFFSNIKKFKYADTVKSF